MKKENKKKEVKKEVEKEEKKDVKQEIKKEKNLGFDRSKQYKIGEAIDLVKSLNKAKFDASIELHIRLGIDPKKGDQQVRGAISLPHGTGKTIKVAAFVTPDKEKEVKDAGADYVGGADLIDEIKKSEKTDFQVAVAQPSLMKDLAKIAKILGTRGLMPSPKNETVTDSPEKAVAELKKGKISFKNDNTSNVHTLIGKISFANDKLIENFTEVINVVKKVKPSSSKGVYIKNIVIASSMGPGVKITLSE